MCPSHPLKQRTGLLNLRFAFRVAGRARTHAGWEGGGHDGSKSGSELQDGWK